MKQEQQSLTLAQLVEQQKAIKNKYQDLMSQALAEAKKLGAEQTEIWCYNTAGNSIEVRNQELETLEFNQDSHLSLNLYFNQRKGSASINDLTQEGIAKGVQAAADIARFTEKDPYAGLADANRLATEFPDLSLSHPSNKSISDLVAVAKQAEASALKHTKIKQSEGAGFYAHSSVSLYTNSHGFFATKNTTRFSLSATMIADSESGMQRDSYYSVSRDFSDLMSPEVIGDKVSERLLGRLHQGKASSGTFPVIFTPETARGIWSHMLSALKGGVLYQKSSFLLDKKGQKILPEFVQIQEDPFIAKGFGSSCYDSEGVATYQRDIVTDGVLQDYFLSSYSARRLGLQSTASAGGIHNILVTSQAVKQEELIKQLGTGLLVTEVMGQGVNIVTGNYSRGASGYWFENGETKYFVQGITIAGNLADMLNNIIAIADDVDQRSSILSGSVAIDGLTIATH